MLMKWTYLAIIAWGLAGCRSTEDPPTLESSKGREPAAEAGKASGGDAQDAIRWTRMGEQARLESAYAELENRLDGLWGDSLSIRISMRNQYRRILSDARPVKDNTNVRLKEELRVSSEGVTPEIWEEIRPRTELTLDSLRRLFISADSMQKLNWIRVNPERDS